MKMLKVIAFIVASAALATPQIMQQVIITPAPSSTPGPTITSVSPILVTGPAMLVASGNPILVQ